ncbi:ATP-dependent DNA helicase [Dysgonomonas macrotermitis]|uniref:Exodeoxyribonuclease-5 n=1 Tax=Dysgonomonas macrotermitis TaxID=1346286 RepID=A0A1M4WSE2_9BACT|nr:AAA family ATPase [Dysgonomonas macrotermitis]SHE84211.1 exodeoxyribonuclease-5 [Dysgonomonas macrotermitis]
MSLDNFFLKQIKNNFQFEPTPEQGEALELITRFLFQPQSDSLFLLKGYAGTGKSSLIGSLVKTMTEFKQKTVLLAPTGRAAKVFAGYSNHPAYTIHKKIYRQKRFSDQATDFVPTDNLHKDTLFIVDEASMIGNDGIDSFVFGSGRVLDDLIQYVYSGENCRLLLIGDEAQLPPVMQENSPALQLDTLRGYGLEIHSTTMTQIVRQAGNSGILNNATEIRNALLEETTGLYPKLRVNGFADVKNISGEELIDTITAAYDKDGIEDTMIITRSNKRSNIYNEGVRNRILYREEELSAGDLLMITKNNYFWSEKIEQIDFLANGELIEVLRVRKIQELYGFRFADILVKHPDYEIELEVKILLDTLHSETTGLSKEKNSELFYNILEDYSDITSKAEKMKRMKIDPHYNAVQVKYGYATTCHKAQGGEWKNIFIDIGYITEEHLGVNFYRWLYTAITRATKQLYFVNLPEEFV